MTGTHIDNLIFCAETLDGESVEIHWQDLIQETVDTEVDTVICRHRIGEPMALKYSSIHLQS